MTEKTDLLVASDPGTASGKVAKARRYNIPVLGVEQFATMRASDTIEGPAVSSEERSKRCSECIRAARSSPPR